MTIAGRLTLLATLAAAGCSTATYTVLDPKTLDPKTKAPAVVQQVEADAPGGEAFVTVVYYSKTVPPIVKAKGDSTQLVNATAAAGRAAVKVALKAAK